MINCTGEDTNSRGGAVRVGNLVCCVSKDWWSNRLGVAWEAVAGQVRLCFVGVMSFVNKSNVRIDWLSGTKVTMMYDVVGLVVLWNSRVTRAVVIMSMVVQSSSFNVGSV